MENREQMVASVSLDGNNYGVFYNTNGSPVFSAEKIQELAAVFISRPLVPSASITSWNQLSWISNVPSGTSLYFYVRGASNESSLQTAQWVGPLLNGSGEDISSQTGGILQFKLIMLSSYDENTEILSTPLVTSVRASCYVVGSSQSFYTSTLPLSFAPTYVFLAYNGTIPNDTLVNFSVSTNDSIDPKYYTTINPNTVVQLNSPNNFLKVAISAVGNSQIPFVIDEFAVAVGGDGFNNLGE
jgi:hypothetical protein